MEIPEVKMKGMIKDYDFKVIVRKRKHSKGEYSKLSKAP
jgi:hypothetical protein